MKKQDITNLRRKSVKELTAQVADLSHDLTKEKMEARVNPPKDTNSISARKKTIAIINTIISQSK